MAPKFMCVLADGDLSNECRWLPCRSSPSIMMLMMKVMMMMMMLLLTLPEQSLQDMPPVPRHLWQAFTTPVWGTVTTRTWEGTNNYQLGNVQLEHTYNWIMIFFAITITNKVSTSSLNMLAGGSSISQGRGAPPRPGPSTSPPWQQGGWSWYQYIAVHRLSQRIKNILLQINLMRSVRPASFSLLCESLQLIVVRWHVVHAW